MKSNSNSFGQGASGGNGAANAATPLLTSGRPPQERSTRWRSRFLPPGLRQMSTRA